MSRHEDGDYGDQMSREDLRGYECSKCGHSPSTERELNMGLCQGPACVGKRERERNKTKNTVKS